VTATFGNGQTRRGLPRRLAARREIMVDLPDASASSDSFNFDCRRFAARRQCRHRCRYRAAPRRVGSAKSRLGPRLVADVVGKTKAAPTATCFVTGNLDTSAGSIWGSRSFEGAFDREVAFTDFGGRDVDAIGLRPVNDDAHCDSVTATFRNAGRRTFRFNQPRCARRGPGQNDRSAGARRDIERLDLAGHAEHGRQVTIQVLASR